MAAMSTQAADETQDFEAPAATVWAYRLDFTNLPGYNPSVHEVERVQDGTGPGGVAGAGATYRFDLHTDGGAFPVTLTVTAAEEDRRVDAVMVGRMSAHESFVVTAKPEGGCTATLALWVDLPEGLDDEVVAGLLENGRREIRGELDAMRRALDGRAGEAPGGS